MKKIIFDLRYHLFTFFAVAFCLFSATQKDEVKPPLNPYSEIEIIDTFTKYLEKDLSSDFHMASFAIGYIGPKVSQINNYTFRKFDDFEPDRFNEYRFAKSAELKIYVDTSRIIGRTQSLYSSPPPLEVLKDKKLSKSYIRYQKTRLMSHPIFIENISSDTLQLPGAFHLQMITEAIDRCGDWQPIQSPLRYGCGNGLPYPFLPNGEIILSSATIMHGDFRTKLRLRYGYNNFIYSNEFFGNIDYSQFTKTEYPRRSY